MRALPKNIECVLLYCKECDYFSYDWDLDLFKERFSNKKRNIIRNKSGYIKSVSQSCENCDENTQHEVIGKVTIKFKKGLRIK